MAEDINNQMINEVPQLPQVLSVEKDTTLPQVVQQELITEVPVPRAAEDVGHTATRVEVVVDDSNGENGTVPVRFGGDPVRIPSSEFRGDPSKVLGHPSHDDPTLVRRA